MLLTNERAFSNTELNLSNCVASLQESSFLQVKFIDVIYLALNLCRLKRSQHYASRFFMLINLPGIWLLIPSA